MILFILGLAEGWAEVRLLLVVKEGKRHSKPHFRFQDLMVWREAIELSVSLHRVADGLEGRKLYRYADQLRGAGLSPSNNIAEGAGSVHVPEFRQFLNVARRSVFEVASMAFVFERLALIDAETRDSLLAKCDFLSRSLTSFSRSLK